MNTTEVLKAARELISAPERWTQGAYARAGQFGSAVNTLAEEATCWCAAGAVGKAAGESPVSLSETGGTALWFLNKAADDVSASYSNDTRSHAEVIAMFDRAVALSESASG